MANIQELIEQIKWNKGRYARDAVEGIIENQEEGIPELIKLISISSREQTDLIENGDYMGHIYALYILAKLQVEQAFPLVIKILRKSSDEINNTLGDLGTEVGARWLLGTYNGELELIKELIEDNTVCSFMRSQGLIAMGLLVLWGKEDREEFSQYCRKLIETQNDEVVLGDIAYVAEMLCLSELRQDIKKLYLEDRVDPFYIAQADILPSLRQGEEWAVTKSKNDPHCRYIQDLDKEFRGWACFELDLKENRSYPSQLHVNKAVANKVKVGRNDLCTCGSEKKYKKCCGKK